jgi:quercetin dioxygenase-like cupin family protein/DNA-binding XRE family transcriptional regulator
MASPRRGRPASDNPLPTGSLETIGSRLRDARLQLGISLREMARRINVSPSFVSQVELGKARPSVGTLYAFVSELNLSLDDLMTEQVPRPAAGGGPETAGHAPWMRLSEPTTPVVNGPFPWPSPPSPMQPAETRKTIHLPGVTWQRLTSQDDPMVEFLHVVYEPGGESCTESKMIRHGGHEYGHVVSGVLDVQVDFEHYRLEPGDSMHFDSVSPHRLYNAGDEECVSIWVVVGRRVDGRLSVGEHDLSHGPH